MVLSGSNSFLFLMPELLGCVRTLLLLIVVQLAFVGLLTIVALHNPLATRRFLLSGTTWCQDLHKGLTEMNHGLMN